MWRTFYALGKYRLLRILTLLFAGSSSKSVCLKMKWEYLNIYLNIVGSLFYLLILCQMKVMSLISRSTFDPFWPQSIPIRLMELDPVYFYHRTKTDLSISIIPLKNRTIIHNLAPVNPNRLETGNWSLPG